MTLVEEDEEAEDEDEDEDEEEVEAEEAEEDDEEEDDEEDEEEEEDARTTGSPSLSSGTHSSRRLLTGACTSHDGTCARGRGGPRRGGDEWRRREVSCNAEVDTRDMRT